MQQKRFITNSDWSCVESIAKQIYAEEYVLLTKGDIQDIKDCIENNEPFDNEDEGGDMDFPLGEIITAVGIGMTAIQTIIGYMSWRYPRTTPIPSPNRPRVENARDFVGLMLDDNSYNKIYREEVKAELLRKRDEINSILDSMYPDEV